MHCKKRNLMKRQVDDMNYHDINPIPVLDRGM